MTRFTFAKHHLVSLDRFDKSIIRVMEQTRALVGDRCAHSLLPTLVGIDIDYNGLRNAVPLFRSFLNKLITLRDKHFTRFVTDTLWAMESDNGHIFYTYDGPKTAWCDVVWTVRAMGDAQVEICVELVAKNPSHALMQEVSASLKKFVPAAASSGNRAIQDVMLRFYKNTDRVYQTSHLHENFHILMIPSTNGRGYYPIPIHGMTYRDGRRHYKQVIQQLEHQQHSLYEVFTHLSSSEEILDILLSLMQANQVFDPRSHQAKENYALAELIFGLIATYYKYPETNHDVILVNSVNPDLHHVDACRLSMHDLMRYC
jgi:hypothetical protein